jgi:ribosomal protein S18 acetylase RimI-like enzyme
MKFVPITPDNRSEINAFIAAHWLTTEMVIRGTIVDMTRVDGLAVFENADITALLTYIVTDDTLEITSLDSLVESKGVATALIGEAFRIARKENCKRVVVVTTNDNINAIRFYQKRGFDMVALRRNALEEARKLKPEIPLLGENNIPLRHELEFEYVLEE